MKSRLSIDGNDVGFFFELPISQNMAIADIREPDKRNSSFSKTIEIPGTPQVNSLFEHIYNVNSVGSAFNPNLKTPSEYFVNETRVFKGSLQLLKVNVMVQIPFVPFSYECSIVGDAGNLFLDIAGLYLTDIDFSDLDHPFTITTPVMSDPKFNPPVGGVGYVYPYIDYGLNILGAPRSDMWVFEHLKPAIYEKEYLTRIFANAGYSWSNTSFLNFFHMSSIVIPDVNEGALKLPEATIAANQFRAGLSADSTTNYAGSFSGSVVTYAMLPISPVPFNDDTSSPYFDPSGLYNTGTFIFTVATAAYYDISAVLNLTITLNSPATSAISNGTVVGDLILEKSTNGGSSWFIVGTSTFNAAISGTTGPTSVTIGISANKINSQHNPGDIFRTRLDNLVGLGTFLNGALVPITGGTTSIDITIVGGGAAVSTASTLWALIKRGDLPYGGTVIMNDTIPKNITQLDFVTSIIKAENLYLELDKNDSTVYNIHPREDFVQLTAPLDWTEKLDISKKIEIFPMGDLSYKKYLFTYKNDADYYNKTYFDTHKEVYGQYTYDVDNDFLRDEKKIELVFSPTPIASWNSHAVITPRFFKMETLPNGAPKVAPIKCNIRRLFFTGPITNPAAYNGISYNGTTGQETTFSYPYAGDVANPFVPQIDLNFGTPRALFWEYPAQQYTTNTRFNERYSKWMSEITDRDSKIVKAYFLLDEKDISTFSFRKIVWVNDAYYIVNRIIDYNPQVRSTTQVELLKLKTGAVFVAQTLTWNIPVNEGGNSSDIVRNGGNSVGYGNDNGGVSSFITGTDNVIGSGASNVNILGSTNVSVSGQVQNFWAVNISDEEITSEYSNRGKVGGYTEMSIAIIVEEQGADFTVSQNVDEYRVNATGSNIIVSLLQLEKKQTFFKTDVSVNYVRITPDGGLLINGQAYLDITTQYDSLEVTFNGTEYLAR